MTQVPDSAPAAATGVRRRLFALGFVDELGPVYALYTIWFTDNGITAEQISIVFLIWAIVDIVLEVPSGAIADLVDRRRLLAVAFALRAIGIAIWVIEPSFFGVLIGASLWSIHSSLASGAWEANVHDQLTAVGQERRYAPTMARLEQFGSIGIALGALVATAWVAAGGTIVQLGWITVALHAVSITLVLRLPDVRWVRRLDATSRSQPSEATDSGTRSDRMPTDSAPGSQGAPADGHEHHGLAEIAGEVAEEIAEAEATWVETLRDGVRFTRRSRLARRMITVGALVGGLFIIDEYVPLLAEERGASDTMIPVFVTVVFLGLVAGDEIVVRRPEISGRLVGTGLTLGGLAMLVAMLTTSMWPLLLVGVGYAALEVTYLISDARFQEQLPPAQRATATSVRSFFEGIVSVIAIGAVTLLSGDGVATGALAGIALVLAATGLLAVRWIPRATAAAGDDR